MTEKLLVPDIGDFENVEVIELLVAEGQEIKINDPVVTIESDKSSVEIPSTFSGKIETIKVKVGDKVSKGDLILNISNSNKETTSSEDVPKNTENLIQEAENFLKKNEEKKSREQKTKIENVGSGFWVVWVLGCRVAGCGFILLFSETCVVRHIHKLIKSDMF